MWCILTLPINVGDIFGPLYDQIRLITDNVRFQIVQPIIAEPAGRNMIAACLNGSATAAESNSTAPAATASKVPIQSTKSALSPEIPSKPAVTRNSSDTTAIPASSTGNATSVAATEKKNRRGGQIMLKDVFGHHAHAMEVKHANERAKDRDTASNSGSGLHAIITGGSSSSASTTAGTSRNISPVPAMTRKGSVSPTTAMNASAGLPGAKNAPVSRTVTPLLANLVDNVPDPSAMQPFTFSMAFPGSMEDSNATLFDTSIPATSFQNYFGDYSSVPASQAQSTRSISTDGESPDERAFPSYGTSFINTDISNTQIPNSNVFTAPPHISAAPLSTGSASDVDLHTTFPFDFATDGASSFFAPPQTQTTHGNAGSAITRAKSDNTRSIGGGSTSPMQRLSISHGGNLGLTNDESSNNATRTRAYTTPSNADVAAVKTGSDKPVDQQPTLDRRHSYKQVVDLWNECVHRLPRLINDPRLINRISQHLQQRQHLLLTISSSRSFPSCGSYDS